MDPRQPEQRLSLAVWIRSDPMAAGVGATAGHPAQSRAQRGAPQPHTATPCRQLAAFLHFCCNLWVALWRFLLWLRALTLHSRGGGRRPRAAAWWKGGHLPEPPEAERQAQPQHKYCRCHNLAQQMYCCMDMLDMLASQQAAADSYKCCRDAC